MATVFISGLMARFIGVILFQISGKDRVRCCGKTEATTEVAGRQGINMAKGRFFAHFQER